MGDRGVGDVLVAGGVALVTGGGVGEPAAAGAVGDGVESCLVGVGGDDMSAGRVKM